MLLKGKVIKVEWVNPHAWIHLEVSECSGIVKDCKTQVWMVEGGTPNTLLRRGITRDSLKAGTEIVVDGYQSKDRSNRANGRDITFPDGRKLFMGSSGTGAPRDGRDATEPPALDHRRLRAACPHGHAGHSTVLDRCWVLGSWC